MADLSNCLHGENLRLQWKDSPLDQHPQGLHGLTLHDQLQPHQAQMQVPDLEIQQKIFSDLATWPVYTGGKIATYHVCP